MAAKKGGTSLESMIAARRAAAAPTEAPAPEPAALGDGRPAPVPINIYVAAEDRRRLRVLALERDTSVQALGMRAWNLLLAAEGLPPLAPSSSYVPPKRGGEGER